MAHLANNKELEASESWLWIWILFVTFFIPDSHVMKVYTYWNAQDLHLFAKLNIQSEWSVSLNAQHQMLQWAN